MGQDQSYETFMKNNPDGVKDGQAGLTSKSAAASPRDKQEENDTPQENSKKADEEGNAANGDSNSAQGEGVADAGDSNTVQGDADNAEEAGGGEDDGQYEEHDEPAQAPTAPAAPSLAEEEDKITRIGNRIFIESYEPLHLYPTQDDLADWILHDHTVPLREINGRDLETREKAIARWAPTNASALIFNLETHELRSTADHGVLHGIEVIATLQGPRLLVDGKRVKSTPSEPYLPAQPLPAPLGGDLLRQELAGPVSQPEPRRKGGRKPSGQAKKKTSTAPPRTVQFETQRARPPGGEGASQPSQVSDIAQVEAPARVEIPSQTEAPAQEAVAQGNSQAQADEVGSVQQPESQPAVSTVNHIAEPATVDAPPEVSRRKSTRKRNAPEADSVAEVPAETIESATTQPTAAQTKSRRKRVATTDDTADTQPEPPKKRQKTVPKHKTSVASDTEPPAPTQAKKASAAKSTERKAADDAAASDTEPPAPPVRAKKAGPAKSRKRKAGGDDDAASDAELPIPPAQAKKKTGPAKGTKRKAADDVAPPPPKKKKSEPKPPVEPTRKSTRERKPNKKYT